MELTSKVDAEVAGITGQAIGMGGHRLALWTHPVGTVVEFEPES